MNEEHLAFCAGPEWAEIVRTHILPWSVGDRDLGDDVLEVGAGPGLTTDVLRWRVPRLTAVELDADLAAQLAERLAETNVEVVCADGTTLPFPSDRFSAATCFTMLHHVPSIEQQDRILSELRRVLRPGGMLVGTDSVASPDLREFHAGDIYLPVDPHEMADRLDRAGFVDVDVEQRFEWDFRFHAVTPV